MEAKTALVVLITTPSVEVGRTVAQALLGQKLAACVNILPGVQSLYVWEGKVQEDGEVLLVVKTRSELFERLSAAVQAVHPYQLPEIIALPVQAGLPGYLQWIEEVTEGGS